MRLPPLTPTTLPRIVTSGVGAMSRRVADGSRRNAGQALLDLQARRADSESSRDLLVRLGPTVAPGSRRTA